ncbi:hypothetical protein BC941DRAFT_516888 [Chlamydoabsidia padenii]|nr:hypothetical protein BC941DRAFT_516888 [Chlamydoabsidia padenii]
MPSLTPTLYAPINVIIMSLNRTSLKKGERGFICPSCEISFNTTRSFFQHLSTHGLTGSHSKKRTFGTVELDEDYSDKSEDLDTENDLKHVHVQPLSLGNRPPMLTCFTNRETILTASDSLFADESAQNDKIMLATLGRWTPPICNCKGQQHGLLTSAVTASALLENKSAFGTWSCPAKDTIISSATKEIIDPDHLIYHIKTTR